MQTKIQGRILTIVLALLVLGAVQIACGVFSGSGPDPNDPSAAEEPDDGSGSEGQGGEGSSSDESGENIVEPEFESDTLPCPPNDTTLYLGFDHALTINYEETSITHFLHEGWLLLKVVDDNGTIVSAGSPSLTYTMEGMMSAECTLYSEGTMMPSAYGSCEAGVVSLIIEENWMPLAGSMECVDTDGSVDIVPFNVPRHGFANP